MKRRTGHKHDNFGALTSRSSTLRSSRSRTARASSQERNIGRASPIRALLWRWRWVSFALLIAAISQSVVSILESTSVAMAHVAVAKSDLSTGDTLSSSNVEVVNLPEKLLPEHAVSDLTEINDEVIAAPLPRGMPIIKEQLLNSSFSTHAPPNTVVTTVTLADDATLGMLRAGNRIDLYAPARETTKDLDAELLVKNAVVLSTVNESKSAGGLFNDFSNKSTIMVAIPNDAARLVIGIGAKTPLRAVISK
ncbi:Flp pilus assembly protein CpaB [Arcanobacterium pluranimalium]|uniref:SAF domain-containing protein n=1 Tax=Arcanobacterium pluranimalium TaxID=108028 RepID=UPI00195DC7C6|nr:SAF domain-containing protein [Arcanobacterium pluranimalium]MBM7824659.1 Flp pilus assembly protein CpaB [Arcanobacterium pluranimalium]